MPESRTETMVPKSETNWLRVFSPRAYTTKMSVVKNSEDSPRRRTKHQDLLVTSLAEADEPIEQISRDEQLFEIGDQSRQNLDTSPQKEGYNRDQAGPLQEENTRSWNRKSVVSASEDEIILQEGQVQSWDRKYEVSASEDEIILQEGQVQSWDRKYEVSASEDEIILHEGQVQSWDRKYEVSASEAENLADDVVWEKRECERDNLFIPDESTRYISGQLPTNKERIDLAHQLFEAVKNMPDGKYLQIHFNSELPIDKLSEGSPSGDILFVKSLVERLSTAKDNEKTEIVSTAIPSYHSQASPNTTCRYYIPGFLGGHYVQADPDTGASHDMISENYATANNYHINPLDSRPMNLPGGRKAWTLGTITLTFRFERDEKEYPRIFQVMKELSHSCILGNGFLKLTKTLSVRQNFLDRVRQVAERTPAKRPRFHLIGGSHERVQGTLNGHQICALPDTGSDVNIIRSDVSKTLGLKIWSDSSHRKLLELGDGSFVRTLGAAYNAQWSFGPRGFTEPLACDFQVLDDIPCDVILSNSFLFDNSAFELYEHYFYEASSIGQLETYAQLNCITEAPVPEQELDEMMMDVYFHGNEEDRIAGILPMEPPRVERVRFKINRQRFSRIFTGNTLPIGTEGNAPSPGGTAPDPALSPSSTPLQQPNRRWIDRVVRLIIRRSDHGASPSASPSSVP